MNPDTETEYRIGDAQLHPQRRRLLVAGQDSRIGARAFDLLLALVESRERTVTKNELLDRVWPGLVVEENNLQVHISSLRKLLGAQAIATVPGRGYRFTAPVDGAAALATTPTSAAAAAPPGGLTQMPNNLPAEVPELFGRTDDLGALHSLTATHKLVTVVGAGGIGKTALAHALAQRMRDSMQDGVWLVELAPLAHASLVVATVAGVLGIRITAEAPLATLAAALGKSRMLLVLDNCEGLLDGIAELAIALYRNAPNVRLLATSQEPLRLPHEQVYRLGPLAVPEVPAVDLARQAGAVALFSARARAVQPAFALDARNVAAVVDICRQLDGIALAIELAAARVPLLGLEGLGARLGERFRLLTGGSRLALRRHQTLRAALDWSCSLLSPPEQAVFRRLGIFIGGFSLEAVQALAGEAAELDHWAVLEHLGALVDKSLVVAEPGATRRYRLLETSRAYALELLADNGETEATVKRHAEVMQDIFERADDDCFGEHGSMDIDALIEGLWPELDNLRAALAWAMNEAGQTSAAIALATTSATLLRQLGLTSEALAPLLELQHRLDHTVEPLRAAQLWETLACLGGEGAMPLEVTLEGLDRAERTYRQQAAPRRLFQTLYHKAWPLALAHRLAEAEALLREMSALEQASWPSSLRGMRLNLQHLLSNQHGQPEEALRFLRQWHSLLPATGHVFDHLLNIGNQCCTLNVLERFDEVEQLARATLERFVHDRRYSFHTSQLFSVLFTALVGKGELQGARAVLREGAAYWQRSGSLGYMCADVGLLLARQRAYAEAARLAGAESARLERLGIAADRETQRQVAALMQCLAAARVPSSDIERWMDEGALLATEHLAAMFLEASAQPD
jgi:predicted ATPase/DNA-binding winged helix-turn-helix (wHTH) protein